MRLFDLLLIIYNITDFKGEKLSIFFRVWFRSQTSVSYGCIVRYQFMISRPSVCADALSLFLMSSLVYNLPHAYIHNAHEYSSVVVHRFLSLEGFHPFLSSFTPLSWRRQHNTLWWTEIMIPNDNHRVVSSVIDMFLQQSANIFLERQQIAVTKSFHHLIELSCLS